MVINLCTTNDSLNVINKTVTTLQQVLITLPKEVDLYNLELRLIIPNSTNVSSINYVSIPELNRFYIVNKSYNVGGDVWRFELTCDVLETYKSEIMTSNARVTRGLKNGDYASDTILAEDRKIITRVYSTRELEPSNNLIITTVGG